MGDEARGDQRMAAKIGEEIGLQRHDLGAEGAPRRLEQRGLGGVPRLVLLVRALLRRELQGLQGAPIDFAGRQARQCRDRLVAGRHHVGGNLPS